MYTELVRNRFFGYHWFVIAYEFDTIRQTSSFKPSSESLFFFFFCRLPKRRVCTVTFERFVRAYRIKTSSKNRLVVQSVHCGRSKACAISKTLVLVLRIQAGIEKSAGSDSCYVSVSLNNLCFAVRVICVLINGVVGVRTSDVIANERRWVIQITLRIMIWTEQLNSWSYSISDPIVRGE